MTELFLDSLEIQNFRVFKHLKIEKLGRVNLIVGKNSVGKTSLLEAIWVYNKRGSLRTMLSVLERRKEFNFSSINSFSLENAASQSVQNIVASIFNTSTNFTASIGSVNNIAKKISITKSENKVIEETAASVNIITVPGLAILQNNKQAEFFRFDKNIQQLLSDFEKNVILASGIFLQTTGLSDNIIGELWNKIVVTDLETQVTKALQIINKDIVRVAVAENNSQQTIYVGFTESTKRATLQSLGEGVSRIFQIILALVNCQDGVLLVDEIENGLYHGAQLDLWKVIFELANRLNVQVFATTHSWDCITAFQEVSAQDEHEEAMLISLRTKSDGIVPISYDERRLEIATNQQIEVR